MIESRDKGIIQRVLDQIYGNFAKRQDLEKNCEIKISFLEIYKEHVTDLLEGHKTRNKNAMTNNGSRRSRRASFIREDSDTNHLQVKDS